MDEQQYNWSETLVRKGLGVDPCGREEDRLRFLAAMMLLKRSLLAAAFVMGAWDDILPISEYLSPPQFRTPFHGSAPSSQQAPWSDDDAEDGFALGNVSLEPVLMAERHLSLLNNRLVSPLVEPVQRVNSDPQIRGILHVPISAGLS
jgi:hypothetical protein